MFSKINKVWTKFQNSKMVNSGGKKKLFAKVSPYLVNLFALKPTTQRVYSELVLFPFTKYKM